MIQLKKVSLYRASKPLILNTDLTISANSRLGLVGANGVGKSSLFALIRGELAADQGEVLLPAHWTIAHVAQHTSVLSTSAIEMVLNGDQELRRLESALSCAEAANDGNAIGQLHDELTRIDAWSARERAARLLNGLGFEHHAHTITVAHFSGGWRMRLNLAQALMCRSELLLLDEPTNHLDLEAVLWLQEWLKRYPGTLIVISHDRDFLDAVTTHTVELAQQTLTLYLGNYSQFENTRAQKLARQQHNYSKQQRQIEHLESYINRFKAKATKARQAQSRIKALERLERIAPAHADSPFDFQFDLPSALPNPLLTLEDVSIGYDHAPIFSHLTLWLEAGSRIGLLGSNGVGKSTLIKLLAGKLPPLAGQRTAATGLKIGYFSQHQIETLRDEDSALEHLRRSPRPATEQQRRNFLGGFNFHGHAATEPIAAMSGGEKARLALALIVWERPNLLLLDEPTNHLDLEMRHALTLALQQFAGALVLVSHDRALINVTTDQFWLVDAGNVRAFDGDLEDYRQWRLARLLRAEQAHSGKRQPQERKQQKRQQAELQQQLAQARKPIQQRLVALEQQLDTLATEKTALATVINSAEAYTPPHCYRLPDGIKRYGEINALLTQLEDEWLILQQQLDQLSS